MAETEIKIINGRKICDTTARDQIKNKVDKIEGKGLSTVDFTTEKDTKLNSIAENANNYVHPTKHNADIITQDETHRFVTDEEKTKLSGIAENANNYVHPENHPATLITEDETHRFVTDTEKAKWNNKSDFNGSYNSLTDTPTIPSKTSQLTNDSDYTTKKYVDDEIAKAQIGGGDVPNLSNYATKEELSTKVDKVMGKSLIDDTEIERLKTIKNYNDSEIKASLEQKANKNELHSHENKSVLDSINQDKITSWNNKSNFDGNYGSLKNAPILSFNEVGELVVTIGDISKTFVPKVESA